MGLKDIARNWIINLLDLNELTDMATRDRVEKLAQLRNYYDGLHKMQLKTKPNKFDDNLTVNLCQLIINKSVSALVGDPENGEGLSWSFPSETGEEKPQSIAWLDNVWEANRKNIWMHLNALSGAQFGFPAVKIVPMAVVAPASSHQCPSQSRSLASLIIMPQLGSPWTPTPR